MPFFDGWEEFYKIFIVIEGKGGRYGSFWKYIKQLHRIRVSFKIFV